MPFRTQRSMTTPDEVEILKFPVGLHAVKSIVLDANTFAVPNPLTSRYIVPAGTVLKISPSNTNQYTAYNGSGTIQGILAHNVDLAAQASNAVEPAAMFYHGCVFATTAIVGFTTYAAALVSALTTCKFE
jgi:hypothetical protein